MMLLYMGFPSYYIGCYRYHKHQQLYVLWGSYSYIVSPKTSNYSFFGYSYHPNHVVKWEVTTLQRFHGLDAQLPSHGTLILSPFFHSPLVSTPLASTFDAAAGRGIPWNDGVEQCSLHVTGCLVISYRGFYPLYTGGQCIIQQGLSNRDYHPRILVDDDTTQYVGIIIIQQGNPHKPSSISWNDRGILHISQMAAMAWSVSLVKVPIQWLFPCINGLELRFPTSS